jgi:hypothetical protein
VSVLRRCANAYTAGKRLSKVESSRQQCTVVAANAPWTKRLQLNCRSLGTTRSVRFCTPPGPAGRSATATSARLGTACQQLRPRVVSGRSSYERRIPRTCDCCTDDRPGPVSVLRRCANAYTASKRLSKVESSRQRCTAVAANAPYTKRLQLKRRSLTVALDRPPTTGFIFILYNSTMRRCPTKFSPVNSGGLFPITALLRILIAAFKSRFTNSIRFLPSLVVYTNASSSRNFALLSICSSVGAPYFFKCSGPRWHFSISTL